MKSILILLILIFAIYMLQKASVPSFESYREKARSTQSVTPAKPREADYHIEAKVACMDYVEAALKAPSTAKFASGSEIAAYRVPGKNHTDIVYKVTGYLDAQNSFGAMIRSTFYCTVKRDPLGSESWKLMDIGFDQRI